MTWMNVFLQLHPDPDIKAKIDNKLYRYVRGCTVRNRVATLSNFHFALHTGVRYTIVHSSAVLSLISQEFYNIHLLLVLLLLLLLLI